MLYEVITQHAAKQVFLLHQQVWREARLVQGAGQIEDRAVLRPRGEEQDRVAELLERFDEPPGRDSYNFV